MYKCKHFKIQELVPPHVYEERGDKSWLLLDARSLFTLDTIRDNFGPVVVNNWHSGGDRRWSGLRTPESPYYSPYSQHTFGRAFDGLLLSYDVEKARSFILANKEKFPHLTGLELGVSWLHFDTRNVDQIMTFGA